MRSPAPKFQLVTASGHPSWLLRAAGAAIFCGVLAAGIVGLRVAQLGEPMSSRSISLSIIAGLSGLIGGFLLSAIIGRYFWDWKRSHVVPFAIVMCAGGAIALFAAIFAVHIRFIRESLEATPFTRAWFAELIISPLGAVGMFLQTGTKYWLPWPAPIFGLCAGVIITLLLVQKR